MVNPDTMETGMNNKAPHRRKTHFIKKGFQLNFSIRFLFLIFIEAVLMASLFWYLSHNTLTTSYQESQLRIENTSSFFFPAMTSAGLIIIGVVGIIGLVGLIFISHKIAGPLYRFEESLKEIGEGDLTHRVQLRKKDQLSDLADRLNTFTSTVEKKMLNVKSDIHETTKIMAEIQLYLSLDNSIEVAKIEPLFKELSRKHNELIAEVDHFKTSEGGLKEQ